MITVASEIGAHRSAFLQLEALASLHYNEFVFDDASQAQRVQALLFDSGEAEYCPPEVRLALRDGECVGMLAFLPGHEVRRRRLANALLLARGRGALTAAAWRRMALASGVLLRPADDESYLARVAVDAVAQGGGIGARLVARFLEESRAAGASRGVLAVAAANAAAIAFYERLGFHETARPCVTDPESGRTLPYVHMARDLRRTRPDSPAGAGR
jgi:ribosomal protein S18 acetylase RimI-like enzyme